MDKIKNINLEETFNIAVTNHRQNKIKEAQILYNKILEVNPNHSQALNNLGTIYINLKEHQKAKECYEKIISINPNYANVQYNLGIIFKQLGDIQKAINHYENAIAINPNYVDAYYNLSNAFRDLEKNEKAKVCYEKTIELNPNHVNAHNNLGVLFQNLNNYQKAKECYEKAIEINFNNIDAHNNLASAFKALGEHQKAISHYEKVLQIDPDNIHTINSLSALLGLYKVEYKSEADKTSFKKLILLLFKKDNIKPIYLAKNARLLLLSNNESNDLLRIINSKSSLLTNKVVQNLLEEELLYLILQKSLFADIFWEKLLNKLRCEILFNLENSNKNILNELFIFIISLAEQCWLNEYIYSQSIEEINLINKLKDSIEKNKEVNELEVAILACYIPLNTSKIITGKLLAHKSTNILFNDLITVQISEPLNEKELVKSIKSLDKIVDPVSKEVRDQYEENPYPRWRCTNKFLSKNFFFWLNNEIEPNQINYNNKFNNPNVLVAGCGTGSHPILTTRYKNSNILAVDLSLSSLAYAKRKTEEIGYKNIEYMHADILQLNKLNKKFDVIESSGVLHHMKDPMAGFKVILDILEPYGFLKLGLYSETARQHIVSARELIKMKNLKNTNEDIKNFRQDVIKKKVNPLIQKVILTEDFYSTSNIRDLLFHVQEHCFTIPKISKILKDLNLEFLGFYFNNKDIKERYKKKFPKDKKCNSLDNWHQFESNNPNIFVEMYQFWVKKLQ